MAFVFSIVLRSLVSDISPQIECSLFCNRYVRYSVFYSTALILQPFYWDIEDFFFIIEWINTLFSQLCSCALAFVIFENNQ